MYFTFIKYISTKRKEDPGLKFMFVERKKEVLI